jgi:hypothetical protein
MVLGNEGDLIDKFLFYAFYKQASGLWSKVSWEMWFDHQVTKAQRRIEQWVSRVAVGRKQNWGVVQSVAGMIRDSQK